MLEEIAIIALAIFNQFSFINAEQNRNVFLAQFVDFDDISQTGSITSGQDMWGEDAVREGGLEILPEKTKSADLDINAVSAFAMDAGTDYPLYDKNSKKKMSIASLSKIMTAVVVLENKSLDETVTISSQSVATFGDKRNLVAGEKIKLEDLLQVMIIDSNNAAAVALAEHTGGSVENFVDMMNQKAEVLGLKGTKFVNPTGLDAEGEDNYSTAFDLVQLIDYALGQDRLWEISRTSEVTVFSLDKKQTHYVKNTDELLGQLDNIYGGKTGYTVEAGECLALITETADKKHKVVSVVLNAEDRFSEMKKLTSWVFDVYAWGL